MPISSSRLALVLAPLFAGVLLAAPPASASAPADRVLEVVSPWTLENLDPVHSGMQYNQMQVGETLVGIAADGTIVPRLATNWSVDADRLTWRFRVRPGVVFHDGTPLTAAAVVASLERSAKGRNALAPAGVVTMTATGDEVAIRTAAPFSMLPNFLADNSNIIVAPGSYRADGTLVRVHGTGPYRLVATEGNAVLEVEAFDRYWGDKPSIRRARFTAVPNPSTRGNMALTGDADVVFSLDPATASRAAGSAAVTLVRSYTPRVSVVTLDLARPQFADPAVRKAVNMAIDRTGIARALLGNADLAAAHLLTPSLAAWTKPAVARYRFDVAGANALLDAAGWTRGGDGIRTRDGVRLSAKLLTFADRPELPNIAAALQSQFAAIGMRLEVAVQDWTAIPAAVQSGTLEMALSSRTFMAEGSDPIGVIVTDFTAAAPDWGANHWARAPQMKALTERYLASFDEDERGSLRADMTALIHDDVAVFPIAWYQEVTAVSSRVEGLVVDPFEKSFYLTRLRWR